MLRILKRMVLPALALLLSGCIKPGSDEVLVTPYTKIDFTAGTEAREFTISSNFLWTIEIADTWLAVNPMKGYGDRNVTVTALPNTDLEARQTSFFILGEKTRREITVYQAGEIPVLSLDNTQKTVRAQGDTVSVGVTSNVDMTVTSEADWISFKETKTVTTRRYVFTVGQNTSLEGRSGRIRFAQKNGTLSATFTIVQDGESPGVEVDTEQVDAVAAGGQYKVTVISNIEWEAITDTPWIHITGTRLMQPHDCVFTVDENQRVEPRQGSVVIHAPGYPGLGQTTVHVSQQGAEPVAVLDPEALKDVPAAGGTYTVAVQANFNWEEDLSGTEGWVSEAVRQTGGLKITVDRNDDIEPRTTQLRIVQENGTYAKNISIDQLAGEKQLMLPPQGSIPGVPAAGGIVVIPVTSNVPWEAGVSEDWLAVVQTKGLETKILTLQVNPNTRIEPRQALLYVMTQGTDVMALSRIITQEGALPSITCDPDTLQVPSPGGSYTVPVNANVPWKVLSQPSWVESLAVQAAGEYDGTIAFTVLPNRQTVQRTGKIEISRTDGTLRTSLVVRQDPEAVFVNASVDVSGSLHNEGDLFTLTVESNLQTDYLLDVSWIVNTGKAVEDRTTTWTFQVMPVPTVSPRTALLKVREAGSDQVYRSFSLVQQGARIAQRDSTALVRFYNNMKGWNWRDTHLWNLQLPAENWAGVTLETAVRNGARYVKELALSNGRLDGSVGDGQHKDPLSELTFLEKLDLSDNSGITGWLPVSWKDLNNLESLDLGNCNLTNFLLLGYNIPVQYATGLRNLKVFIILNNLLNGAIPREILDHPHFAEWNFQVNMQPQKGTNQLSLPDEPSDP